MGRLQDNITSLIESEYERGVDGAKIARRLIEAGLRMKHEEEALDASSRIAPAFSLIGEEYDGKFYMTKMTSALTGEDERLAALLFAGDTFDRYARNHFAKSPPQIEKAEANVKAALMMFQALGEDYTPPEMPSGVDFRPVENESASSGAFGGVKPLLRAVTGSETRGIDTHFDDIPYMTAAIELGLLTRDDVSDVLSVTAKGREAIGLRPEGLPSLPVEVAALTENIEERELAAQYVDAKVAGCERLVREDANKAAELQYVAAVLAEIAHEFRIGLHLPALQIEGKIIPYNESRDTGVRHADTLSAFFQDVYQRNVKAGWWTDIETGKPKLRNVGELLMLFVTEIAEAYESYIEDSADDKLPQFPGLGVELADLGIRWADMCGALAAGVIPAFSDTFNPGEEMFKRVVEIAKDYEAVRKTPQAVGEVEEGEAMPAMDVALMTDAKLDFNAHRADHKIENRLKDDGKKT